jgi:DNA-binding MarR family transcriptional regulator
MEEQRQLLLDRFREAYWAALHQLDALRLRQWERSNLTLPQLRVLFHVLRTPGITTGQLARMLGITMSTTSGLVAKLVGQGLLVRGQAEADRRQIPLQVTDAGRSLAGELAGSTRPFMGQVAERLGDDLERVTSALLQLAETAGQVRAADVEAPYAEGSAEESAEPSAAASLAG